MNGYQRFLALTGLAVAMLMLAAAGFNYMVDPFWMSGGNKLAPRNYAFNERVAKANLLFSRGLKPSCILFGTSKTTIMRGDRLSDESCFNFGFGLGRGEEYLAFARYLKGQGIEPELIYVDLSRLGFLPAFEHPLDIPDFIRDGLAPPTSFLNYFSLDLLELSMRTMLLGSPYVRYYGPDLAIRLTNGWAPYDPPKKIILDGSARFDPDKVEHFLQLRRIFPRARMIGWIPPHSPWNIAGDYMNDRKGQVETMRRLLPAFDEIFDFSAPSPVTMDTRLTYDGIHYVPEVLHAIEERMAVRDRIPPGRFGYKITSLAAWDAWFATQVEIFLTQTNVAIVEELPANQVNPIGDSTMKALFSNGS